MKFDFNHIDPRTGLPREVKREEDRINLMTRIPARSCYVRLLQNRVNLRSAGNLRYAVRLWYDVRTKNTSCRSLCARYGELAQLPIAERAKGSRMDRGLILIALFGFICTPGHNILYNVSL